MVLVSGVTLDEINSFFKHLDVAETRLQDGGYDNPEKYFHLEISIKFSQ